MRALLLFAFVFSALPSTGTTVFSLTSFPPVFFLGRPPVSVSHFENVSFLRHGFAPSDSEGVTDDRAAAWLSEMVIGRKQLGMHPLHNPYTKREQLMIATLAVFTVKMTSWIIGFSFVLQGWLSEARPLPLARVWRNHPRLVTSAGVSCAVLRRACFVSLCYAHVRRGGSTLDSTAPMSMRNSHLLPFPL